MNQRGFEVIKEYENKGIELPKRQSYYSAGYDIEACEEAEIEPGEVKLISTGIKAYMQKDEVLKIYVRSSMAVKRGMALANHVGIIDADYYNNPQNEGHILIAVYNFSKNRLIINKGEKIAQGIFEKYLLIDEDIPKNVHRKGGFGSSNE